MTKRKAFSLVEILLALSILGLSLSFFAYFSDALKLTDSAKREAEIAAYGFNYLENLRAQWRDPGRFAAALGLEAKNPPNGFEVEIKVDEKRSRVRTADFGIIDIVSLRTVTIILRSKEENIDDFLMSTQIVRPVAVIE